jgi:hypothetical protein
MDEATGLAYPSVVICQCLIMMKLFVITDDALYRGFFVMSTIGLIYSWFQSVYVSGT